MVADGTWSARNLGKTNVSYPAFEAFSRVVDHRRAVRRVYQALQPPRLDFALARPVKTIGLAHELKLNPRDVRAALNRLIGDGYLIEHGRDRRGVRSLRLAYIRATGQPKEAKAS